MAFECGRLRRMVLALVAVTLFSGCEGQSPGGRGPHEPLTLGLLPDEDPDRQAERYRPLLAAIRESTGREVRLLLPASYEELVYRFRSGEVDVGYFGGYTFLRAQEAAGAVPLVMRDIDARFVSYIVVPDDSEADSLAELRGARFSFGARSSTSGHMMPRHFLSEQGIVPEDFFSTILYTGAHDLTFRLVADGLVDAGAVNGHFVRALLEASPPGQRPVRVIWQSPPYVDYVWAVQPGMSEQLRRDITRAFLSFSMADEQERQFLESVGAAYFLPAIASDFDQLRAALSALPPGEEPGQGQ